MPPFHFSHEQISLISGLVSQYISSQRNKFRPSAVLLSANQTEAVDGYFSRELLSETRLIVLKDQRLANPDFYPTLRGFGLVNLPDYALMAAITFCDTIVAHQTLTNEMLFHELVHVEQYRQLGIPAFADLYVRGFLYGGGHDEIPLERHAFLLGDRYAQNLAPPSPVSGSVAEWILERRY